MLIALAVAAAAGVGAATGLAWPAPLLRRAPGAPATAALATAAVAGAVAAGGAPTGLWVLDAAYRAAFSVGLTLAGMRSRRRALLVAAGIGTVCSTGGASVAASGLLGLAAGAAIRDVRGRLLGACVGAGLAQVLLRLAWPHAHGATALAAGVAFLTVAISSLRQLRRRQQVLVGVYAGAAALVAVVLLFGLAVLEARPSLHQAVAASNDALDALQAGDTAAAARSFDQASALYARASGVLGAWWARGVRAVPLASQHAAAAQVLAQVGEELAARGADVARKVDPEEAAPTGGRVDLAAVTSFVGPLQDAVRALATGRARLMAARSTWLAPPVGGMLDRLDARVRHALADTTQAVQVAALAPDVLGAGRPRRYVVALTTPAELRGSSGFVGMWAILAADGGRLRLGEVQPIGTLYPGDRQSYQLHAPPDFVARYARRYALGRFPQNAFVSPDFPTSAAVFADLYRQATGEPLDGVVTLDPIALAAVLRLTGPVEVPGWPEPISADNAERVLLFEQYVRYAGDEERQNQFLSELARRAFDRIRSSRLPQPATIARILGPVARGRHLSFWSPDGNAERLFRLLGADGAIGPVRHDFLAVVTHNATEAKIDWFLRRSLRWDVRYDRTSGTVRGTLEVTLHNQAPNGGLPANVIGGQSVLVNAEGDRITPRPGESVLHVSIYSPLGLSGATLDGRPLRLVPGAELGRRVYSTVVLVPPGKSVTLRVRLVGPLIFDEGGYAVDLYRQPTVEPDTVTVITAGRTRRLALDRDRTVAA